jgi:hypothetical protein
MFESSTFELVIWDFHKLYNISSRYIARFGAVLYSFAKFSNKIAKLVEVALEQHIYSHKFLGVFCRGALLSTISSQ